MSSVTLPAFIEYAGFVATAVAAVVVAKAAWHLNTAKIWREEAEAQKTRADRLQDDMDEIKERLTRIEDENKRLIDLLTALDPERVAALHI